jgi:hypothetical protein
MKTALLRSFASGNLRLPLKWRSFQRRALRVAAGFAAALLVFLSGELYLRVFPPSDLIPYLGPHRTTAGPYRNHPTFAITYRDFDAFQKENAARLAPFLPLAGNPDSRPTWAIFGNSFVQMHGMLGDTLRDQLTSHRIFYLGRNEPCYLRLAQLEMLLENGLRLDRVVFVMLPLDSATFGVHPLADIHAQAGGALGYQPRLPHGLATTAVAQTRLGLVSWLRFAKAIPSPLHVAGRLMSHMDESIQNDHRQLLQGLKSLCSRYQTHATLVLIPNHDQITKPQAGLAWQECLKRIAEEIGIDVCDTTALFRTQPDQPGLFIPDKHFSQHGNAILLNALLKHCEVTPSP